MSGRALRLTTIVIVTSVTVVSAFIWRTWKWIEKKQYQSKRLLTKEKESYDDNSCQSYVATKTIVIIDSADEWESAHKELLKDLVFTKVLGMDCEWVDKNKVALLQLCSVKGFCVLLRLFKLKPPYPSSLRSLMAERSILKTGVAIMDDGRKLYRDYGLTVNGYIDLRHLIQRIKLDCHSFGLKGLASKILHLDLNKDHSIRCSNWEAECYSQQQIDYAACDAAVGVDIFVQLVLHKMMMTNKIPLSSLEKRSSHLKQKREDGDTLFCHYAESDDNIDDSIFGRSPSLSSQDSPSISSEVPRKKSPTAVIKSSRKGNKCSPFENSFTINSQDKNMMMNNRVEKDEDFWKMACSVCHGLVDVGYSNKSKGSQPPGAKKSLPKKQAKMAYSTRQRPLWDNCRLEAPDGSLLCICDVRKAEWYIDKSLGDKISDNPVTVRLHFEPSSRPETQRCYYLQEKKNQCVVCGADKDYVRKFVVPFEYKKFFPSALKDHNSHDVLLLCINCHRKSCDFDSKMRHQLANECNAPVESGISAKTIMDHQLQKVRSAARALKLNRSSIPEKRVYELEETLLRYFGVSEVSDDLIELGAEIDARQTAEGFVPHGKLVVQYMSKYGGLLAFQARWRQHFLATMNPKFMPAFWSVDYVAEGWSQTEAST